MSFFRMIDQIIYTKSMCTMISPPHSGFFFLCLDLKSGKH